jgi:surface-anchored protein
MGMHAQAQPAIEYSAGHADIGVEYDASELELHYHFGTDAKLDGVVQGVETEFDLGEVFTRAGDAVKFPAPGGAQWSFLGTSSGNDIWVLPQSNTSGVPFLGVAAEEVGASGDWTGPISYEITGVTRPSGSHFSIFQTDAFGQPVVQVATQDGLSDTLTVPVGSHSHYNWGFTKPGVYQMEMTASGTRSGSGEKVQDTQVVWFAVGDSADPADPTPHTYAYGHGHVGLNYNVNPNPDGEFLNNDGGLFPHVGIPGAGPNPDTSLPRNGPFNPAEVTHIVPGSTMADRSALNPAVNAVLGAVTDNVWILPESSTEALAKNAPWTGPAVASSAYSQFDNLQGAIDDPDDLLGNVMWTLTHVAGPGEVALWVNDQFGNPNIWMASGDGLDPVGGADTILLGSGGNHNNWAFTDLGLYHLTFQWDVEVNGTPLRESATFAFNVVPEPASLALLCLGGGLALMRRRSSATR